MRIFKGMNDFWCSNCLPCRVRDWKKLFDPTVENNGWFPWFWCAGSARTEKPKETTYRPPSKYGSKALQQRHNGGGGNPISGWFTVRLMIEHF